tara:strand:- start:30967 stop:31164 length:198 start_codon:yes stop_codon:yes gene_type:complete
MVEEEYKKILVEGIIASLKCIPEYPENASNTTKKWYKERVDSIKNDLNKLKDTTLHMLHYQITGF